MKRIQEIFNNAKITNLLLLFVSFGIYFFYFHHLILNLNSVLSSITGDTIKNYYTFLYHIKHDEAALNFSGMNFPFGEHVIYTDCQPLFTFLLRLMPFSHNYLVGICHALILISLVCTPLVLNKVFLRLGIDRFASFFISLAVAVLSPQIRRLDGHFALSYECMIPLAILFLLKLFQENKKRRNTALLFTYNCSLFFIHPYMGFGISVMSFFTIMIYSVLNFQKKNTVKNLFFSIVCGLLPILLFRLFMFLTDTHPQRTTEPDGIAMLVANFASVFVPNFGPFVDVLKKLLSDAPQDYEGLSYIGAFTDLLIFIFILVIPFMAKKLSFKKETSSMLFASLILLLFSFGIHNKISDLFHLNTSMFNQFRTLGRFAWFFYYALPVFLVPVLYQSLKPYIEKKRFQLITGALSLLFLFVNLLEANSLLSFYSTTIFKERNFFRNDLLNAEEKKNIKSIAKNKPQAIITLPSIFIGSEVYGRTGSDNAMIPAIIYSYHCALPIRGTYLSRTSITETEAGIELLNAYKNKRKVDSLLSLAPFMVIKTNEELLPDEERLLEKTKIFATNDTLAYGYVDCEKLLKPLNGKNRFYIHKDHRADEDSNSVIFLSADNKRPYLVSKIADYEKAYILDSLNIRSGRYIVSLHFYFTEKTFRGVYSHLVVVKSNSKESVWQYTKPLRLFSGFYKGYAVFEYPIELEKENRYEFLLYGFGDKPYHISNFMLRPAHKDVGVISNAGDTTINNFPKE